MKKFLFSENGKFYKANLHSHSTVSDGGLTPEELKARYKAQGYSILALTDHELLVDHSELDDDEFLTITSMEYGFVEDDDDYWKSRTIEFNLFARDQHNVKQICFDPAYVFHGEKWRIDTLERIGEPFKREYTVESMQKVIDTAKENGFLVSLNHPGYSMESPEFFGQLNGLFAMEIYNHISLVGGGVNDYNPAMYENMLRRGKRLYPIAADDCHGKMDDSDPKCDRYGGFVMIKAERLEYGKVIEALENGEFYSSQGPLIKELYVEDDFVHIKCSPAKYIAMNTEHRPFGGIRIVNDGEYLTEAVFEVPKEQAFFRFDVMDEKGRHANTRAYFIKDIY
ncbi:MAG: PHP domain-containing protein [Clostridia bacterium]|nr:PHP domain-containing protein [Clostridia bacterium]